MIQTYIKPVGAYNERGYIRVASSMRLTPEQVKLNAFQFVDRTEIYHDTGSFNGGEYLKGEFRNASPWYYRGKVHTLESIKARNDPRDETLIWNMDVNRWKRVIELPNGQYLPMEDDAILLSFHGVE
jgi:hypothetical protein